MLHPQGGTRADVGEGSFEGGADVGAGVYADDTTPNFDIESVGRVAREPLRAVLRGLPENGAAVEIVFKLFTVSFAEVAAVGVSAADALFRRDGGDELSAQAVLLPLGLHVGGGKGGNEVEGLQGGACEHGRLGG